MYLNKAFIIGNVTRDPELKALPSGIKVTSFSVATNRVWKDQSGEKKEQADYHNIVVFGKQAETTAQYLRKGSQVFIEGRMQTRSWDANDGTKKYRTEVVADRVQFGKRPLSSSSEDSQENQEHDENQAESQVESEEKMPVIEYPTDDINPDDIPF